MSTSVASAATYRRFSRIVGLARSPNAYIKIHGLGEICARPMPFPQPMRFEDILPFMQMAYETFGASRVMWGSDFPPVAGREGYRDALRWPMEHIDFRHDADMEWVFGRTALSLFRLADRPRLRRRSPTFAPPGGPS